MRFEIVSEILHIEVRLPGGWIRLAEIHWYEAHGIGKRGFKIKRYLD